MCGAIPRLKTRPPWALIAVTPRPPSSATQTAIAAEDERRRGGRRPRSGPRPCPRRRRCAAPRRCAGSPPRPSLADRDPGDAALEPERPARDRAGRRVDPREGPVAGAGHPDRALAGRDPQRALADRDRVGDRDPVAARRSCAPRRRRRSRRDEVAGQAAAVQDATAPPPAPGRRGRSPRSAGPGGVGEDPGRRRRRALVFAGGLDQGARGREAPAGSLATARSITASSPAGISGSVSSAWRA